MNRRIITMLDLAVLMQRDLLDEQYGYTVIERPIEETPVAQAKGWFWQ